MVESATNVAVPVRIAARSGATATRFPTVVSPGKFATLIVTDPEGRLSPPCAGSGGPNSPFPHPAASAAAAAARALFARNARRFTQSSHHMRALLELDNGRLPFSGILVLTIQFVDVDDDGLALPPHGESIHAASRAALDKGPVRTVLRVMLRALKARVILLPFERRVLVRARERERVDHPLPARDDERLPLVDDRPVCRRNRVRTVVAPHRKGVPETHRQRSRFGNASSQRRQHADNSRCGIAQKGAPFHHVRHRAAVAASLLHSCLLPLSRLLTNNAHPSPDSCW